MAFSKLLPKKIIIIIQKNITARRVLRGALRLDKTDPQWAQWISPSLINMNNAFSDVLGQRWGTYSKGLEKLGIKGPRRGFIAAQHGFCPDKWAPQDLLETEWKKEVAKHHNLAFARLVAKQK